MKVLFVGSLINGYTLDNIVRNSRVKPSNSAVNFSNMLAKGLQEANIDLDIISLPTVSTYPGGNLLAWWKRKEKLDFGKEVTWIPCLNLPLLKQLSVRITTYMLIRKWIHDNWHEKDKLILNLSIYPPYSAATQDIGRHFGIKTCSIITDLPEALYQMKKTNGIKKLLADYYSNRMKKLQDRFDYYVLLTEPLIRKIGVQSKPHMIMEGMSDPSIFDGIHPSRKNEKKTVMYSGALSKSFNVQALVDGFMQTEGDYALWLFGYGDLIDYIWDCEKKDPRIHYFGKVDRNVLLQHQQMAHLLISTKSPNAYHADYAFPSKILEYMTSGTAVASTMVGGIPKEYFEYVIPIEGDTAGDVSNCLQTVFQETDEVLFQKGQACKEFAISQKNYRAQAKRIAEFLSNCLSDNVNISV